MKKETIQKLIQEMDANFGKSKVISVEKHGSGETVHVNISTGIGLKDAINLELEMDGKQIKTSVESNPFITKKGGEE